MKPIPPELLAPYFEATAKRDDHQTQAGEAADQRAQALLEVAAKGYSYADIARAIGLSRALVQKLVERARAINELPGPRTR